MAEPIRCSPSRTYTNYSTSDYNGFRPNPGEEGAFEWDSAAAGVAADYSATRRASLQDAERIQRRERAGEAQRAGGLQQRS